MKKRIICDFYNKVPKDEPKKFFKSTEFEEVRTAVNNMYGWLYENGILKKVSFEMVDYDDFCYFAFDVKALRRYRRKMKKSGVDGALLALTHIFEFDYTPCNFSGAIQLRYPMNTYRSNCGCTGRSWEIELVQWLNNEGVAMVLEARKKEGVVAAVSTVFELVDFRDDDKDALLTEINNLHHEIQGSRAYDEEMAETIKERLYEVLKELHEVAPEDQIYHRMCDIYGFEKK